MDKTALFPLEATSLVEVGTKSCDEIFVHKFENGCDIA